MVHILLLPYKKKKFRKLELMGPTGPNSSSCGGPAVVRTQELALLAGYKTKKPIFFSNSKPPYKRYGYFARNAQIIAPDARSGKAT